MIELEFLGAAGTVTGSKHLIRTSKASVLLDCGLFQGRRKESLEKNRYISVDVKTLNAVVLSHAHIDHSGALPSLYKMGYRGPIFAVPATRALCLPMLLDTANIMKSDAAYIDKLIGKGAPNLEKAEILYNKEDVLGTLTLFRDLPYHKRQAIAPGIFLTFLNAGHILGSGICVLDIEDEGQHERLAFTGDLGRHNLPLIQDPETPKGVSCLLMESTYGNRVHDPFEIRNDKLATLIKEAAKRGGKIIIPTFALERAQELIYILKELRVSRRIPLLPVYVDSPLATKLTDIFKQHPECFDEEFLNTAKRSDSPFDFPGLTYVSSVEESKRISADTRPSIILSPSGMCEGGRVLHHLQSTVEDPKNTIIFVGFQAEHTLGRRILEKRPTVKIFGKIQSLEAQVEVLNGYSAHADQNDLISFVKMVHAKGSLRRIILVHGEPSSQAALAEKLQEEGFRGVVMPKMNDRIKL
jgi:metallo-beta-lactamase family protein